MEGKQSIAIVTVAARADHQPRQSRYRYRCRDKQYEIPIPSTQRARFVVSLEMKMSTSSLDASVAHDGTIRTMYHIGSPLSISLEICLECMSMSSDKVMMCVGACARIFAFSGESLLKLCAT